MDLDQVTAFLEVARKKSFSRAAEKLYRTQPAISAQIRALEIECGQKLFDRMGRKIFLTPAGKVLFECGVNLLSLHRETLQRVREAHGAAGGTLVIGANEATCLYVLPQVFAEFKRNYPQVAISIYRNFSQKILLKMAESQIDVGIVTLPVAQNNLKVIPIFEDELQVVVPAGHRLAKRASVKMEDLVEEQLIFPKGGHTRELLEKIFRKQRSRLQISMELASVESIKKFVGAGLGISLISRSYAEMEIKLGILKLIPLQGPKLVRRLGLVYRTDRHLSRAAQAFTQIVHSRNSKASS
ncbi:MAG: LysR substrate-binding domain-containing protein [Acidobacteria bacterium]|nr:LysR substrate-binding domain-containing protein [Acidobacteriota bacterium]